MWGVEEQEGVGPEEAEWRAVLVERKQEPEEVHGIELSQMCEAVQVPERNVREEQEPDCQKEHEERARNASRRSHRRNASISTRDREL